MNKIQKKLCAEAFGTFVLALLVTLSATTDGSFFATTPVLAASVVGIFVYTIGAISGTHLNPAVTVAAYIGKHITQGLALRYIAAQAVGALIAAIVAGSAHATMFSELFTLNPGVIIAEIFGTLILMFGIASVINAAVDKNGAPFVIGGSLFIGVALSALLGGPGILNPAVALALGELSLSTILGPIVGAILGCLLFQFMQEK
jgi:aquaporin Z